MQTSTAGATASGESRVAGFCLLACILVRIVCAVGSYFGLLDVRQPPTNLFSAASLELIQSLKRVEPRMRETAQIPLGLLSMTAMLLNVTSSPSARMDTGDQNRLSLSGVR